MIKSKRKSNNAPVDVACVAVVFAPITEACLTADVTVDVIPAEVVLPVSVTVKVLKLDLPESSPCPCHVQAADIAHSCCASWPDRAICSCQQRGRSATFRFTQCLQLELVRANGVVTADPVVEHAHAPNVNL